jgi:hypothetical protein
MVRQRYYQLGHGMRGGNFFRRRNGGMHGVRGGHLLHGKRQFLHLEYCRELRDQKHDRECMRKL